MAASNTNKSSSVPSCPQRRLPSDSNGSGLGLTSAMMLNQDAAQGATASASATTTNPVESNLRIRQNLSSVLNEALRLLDDTFLDDDLFGDCDLNTESWTLSQ